MCDPTGFCRAALLSTKEGKAALLSLECHNRNTMNRFLYGGLFKAFAEALPVEQPMLKYVCFLKVRLLSHGTYIQQETITLS